MKIIKRFTKIVLLSIVTIYFQSAFSQENYIPGYVIKNNADTLFGFIDYRNWDKNPKLIKFKTEIDNNHIFFNPTEIKEFKVADEIYESGIVQAEISPILTDLLKLDPQLYLNVDTIFLQTVIRGTKSLYYYKNKDSRENFYISQDTAFELLIYKRYLKEKDYKPIVTENKTYVGQLSLYLSDCETLRSMTEKTLYNKTNLSKLFVKYYECSQSDLHFQKKIEKVIPEYGLVAGASLTFLNFFSVSFPYLVNANFSSSYNPAAGIFLDAILPRHQGRWSVYNELLFTTYDVSGSYLEYKNENDYIFTTTRFKYSYLNINNLVRFKYPIRNCYFFINGGVSNAFAISEINYRKKESKLYSTSRIEELLALRTTRKYEQSIILGTGVRYNRFSIEMRFKNGNGMADDKKLNSSTKSYLILLNYRF